MPFPSYSLGPQSLWLSYLLFYGSLVLTPMIVNTGSGYAQNESPQFALRTTGGAGLAHTFEEDPVFSGTANAGLQAMMHVSKQGFWGGRIKQRIGVQTAYHDIGLFDGDFPEDLPRRGVSFGFLFEHIVFNNVTLALSTSAFIPVGFPPGTYPFAVTWQPGWEPQWRSFIRPYVGYRTDWIFAKKIMSVSTLVIGITFAFAYL